MQRNNRAYAAPVPKPVSELLDDFSYSLEDLIIRSSIRQNRSDMICIPPNTYWPGRFVPFEGHDMSPNADTKSVLHQLCEKCRELQCWIFEAPMRRRHQYTSSEITEKFLHSSFVAVQRTANEGCHLCTILFSNALTGSSVGHIFSEESSEMMVIILEDNYDAPYGDEWAYNLIIQSNYIEVDGADELSGSSAPLAPLPIARLDIDRMFELHVYSKKPFRI
jgi:hypothetical protein